MSWKSAILFSRKVLTDACSNGLDDRAEAIRAHSKAVRMLFQYNRHKGRTSICSDAKSIIANRIVEVGAALWNFLWTG